MDLKRSFHWGEHLF